METTDLVERINALPWREEVPDDLQCEVRMRFNEALAGGPNMNGDAGPGLSVNHALDCLYAIERIDELQARVEKLEVVARKLASRRTAREILTGVVGEQFLPPPSASEQDADILEARAALAEDYCGIVEVNEEDFTPGGPHE